MVNVNQFNRGSLTPHSLPSAQMRTFASVSVKCWHSVVAGLTESNLHFLYFFPSFFFSSSPLSDTKSPSYNGRGEECNLFCVLWSLNVYRFVSIHLIYFFIFHYMYSEHSLWSDLRKEENVIRVVFTPPLPGPSLINASYGSCDVGRKMNLEVLHNERMSFWAPNFQFIILSPPSWTRENS